MHTILYLAAQSINVLALAAVVVFQPELRRALENSERKTCLAILIRLIKTERMNVFLIRQQKV